MNNLRLAYVSIFCILLGGCGVTVPECSNKEAQSLVLEAAKAKMMSRLLSEKVSSPGFRMMTQLGENDENTPPEITAQISNGQYEYSTWSKYRGTHEWIGVVVKFVDVEWETKYSNGGETRLDAIRSERVDEATSESTCTAEWYGADDKMPITYTVKQTDSGDDLQVKILTF